MQNQNPVHIDIHIDEIPGILEEFISLAGRDIIVGRKLSKKHKFYPAIEFYLQNKDKNWVDLDIPKFVTDALDVISHFVIVLKPLLVEYSKFIKRPVKELLNVKVIETLSVEAMIASNYVRRGYSVQWPSIFKKDPPDIVIYDLANRVAVDIEVKIKDKAASVETMFDSLSKGLQSLKKRRSNKNERAIIAVHNSKDLHWSKWLEDPDVAKRLHSRLTNEEYNIVSGIIFSGGELIKSEGDKDQEYHTKYVAFRSNAATYQLPRGFLIGSGVV